MESNEATATLLLLNPASLRALQRTTAEGSGVYIFGGPGDNSGATLWGVPYLASNSVPAGKIIVLDVAQQGETYIREDGRLDVGYVDQDFTKNLLTLRAEMRALNIVVRPEAVVYGDLTA